MSVPDAYFSRQHSKSVLCMPILRQAELVGCLPGKQSWPPTHLRRSGLPYGAAGLASRHFFAECPLFSDLQKENSERKRVEEALLESEQRFRDYAETASDWFWESGPDHDSTNVFDKLDAFGIDRGAVIGKREASVRRIWSRSREMAPAHRPLLERHEPFRASNTGASIRGSSRF